MSGVQHESDKKRKRRSFWEPESEKVVEWLDTQTDLGTSLQLIIVDAIRMYGKGDVIKAHLTQRETFDQEPAPKPLAERPSRPTIATAPPKSSEPVTVTTKEDEEPPVLPSFTEQEADEDSKKNDEQDIELESEPGWTPETKLNNEPSFDIQDMRPDADNSQEEESEYDPIAIMMNDIGSKYNK